MIVQPVSNIACLNAQKTFNQFLFIKFGLKCHKGYNRVEYLENLMYIDYIQATINNI